jgi:integrase
LKPIHIAAYVETLQATAAKPTVKQHLAAIRMLFDWLVVGQVLATNPAHAVRGPKHVVKRGKTPVLTEEQARRLLESIDVSTLVGLRDRALIGVMTYAFARIGAVVAMRVEDYYPEGKRWWVRLHEKGGKRHEMPAHHKLEAYIDEYLAAAGIREAGKTTLFRSAIGRTGVLTATPMNRVDAYRMIRREGWSMPAALAPASTMPSLNACGAASSRWRRPTCRSTSRRRARAGSASTARGSNHGVGAGSAPRRAAHAIRDAGDFP